jgi:hypothetical protein
MMLMLMPIVFELMPLFVVRCSLYESLHMDRLIQ